MLAVLLTIALVALPGHVALCLWLNNNINARIVRRWLKHCFNLPLESFLAFGPLALGASIALGYWPMHPSAWNAWQTITGIYLLAAAGVAVAFVPRWIHRQVTAR